MSEARQQFGASPAKDAVYKAGQRSFYEGQGECHFQQGDCVLQPSPAAAAR
jgi:hypothetical protein